MFLLILQKVVRLEKRLVLHLKLKKLQTIILQSYFISISLNRIALRKQCPYSQLFWSVCPPIQTEHIEIKSIFPYSVQMWENTGRNNFEYRHILRSVNYYYYSHYFLHEVSHQEKVTSETTTFGLMWPVACLIFEHEN